ncbi:MAG: glycosyltransferase family 9 protein [Leptolyngbyaceae cyanobacterium CSU_1_4]|nr:glycosyltransferase family 9 protein [Leptolyngbyaceae cyanobacterium CSU_1_4]
MRVVALIPGGVGEQILFFPTLDGLKQKYPDAEIDVVVEPRAKAAYRVSKSVNDVITFDFKDRSSPADWANLLGVIRDRYYDAALSLRQNWGTGLLLWLTGVPTRIGSEDSAGKYFLTHTVPFNADQYTAQSNYDLLQGMGVKAACPEVAISVPKSDIDWAEAEQKRLGIRGSGYVLMYPGKSLLAEGETSYPLASWLTIVEDFQQKQPDMPLVIVKQTGDLDTVTTLTQAVPSLKVTKPADMGKLAALVAGANLMIAPNSVPMHLAIALQVYTLALFGSSSSSQVLPKSDKFIAIQSPTRSIADIQPAEICKGLGRLRPWTSETFVLSQFWQFSWVL